MLAVPGWQTREVIAALLLVSPPEGKGAAVNSNLISTVCSVFHLSRESVLFRGCAPLE